MKLNRKQLLIIIVLTVCLLSACSGEGRYQATLITEGQHQITGMVFGDLIMLGGQVSIPDGAILEGSVHQLGGLIQLDGSVRGDFSYLNGELILGSQAEIDGDLNLGGNQIEGLRESTVGGEVKSGSGVQVPSAPQTRSPGPSFTLIRWLISSLLLGVAASSLERYLPRQSRYVGQAAFNHLPVALAVGTLSGIAGLTLLVLMAYTIVLIPVALLGGAVLGLAVIYGWIAWGMVLGDEIFSHLGIQSGRRTTAFSGAMLFTLMLQILSFIPVLGGLLSALAAAGGLGSVYLTRFGLREFFPESRSIPGAESTSGVY